MGSSIATARTAALISRSVDSRVAVCGAPFMAGCSTSTVNASKLQPNRNPRNSARESGSAPILWSRRLEFSGPISGKASRRHFRSSIVSLRPSPYTFAFKGLFECNWLQALEVGIDPAHASFLHRFFQDEDISAAYGKQFRGASAGSEMPMTKILREYDRPIINVESTEYGLRLIALRELDAERTHVRVTNQVFPHGFVIPMSTEMTISQWHVPVDDENCYWYAIFTSYTKPVDKQKMRDQRLELYQLPDYKSRKNRSNDYGFDPHQQATETYTGMGADINVHDQWAVESMGRIQDRTREHLGQSDKAIIAYRKLLRQEIEKAAGGTRPLMVLDADHARSIQGPATMDGIGPTRGWETYWMEVDVNRRRGAPWAAPVSSEISATVTRLSAAG